MSFPCKSCGASPSRESSTQSFLCEFCGTQNVDVQYFRDYASKVDSGKANRLLQLGLLAFNSGDFKESEKNIEQSIKEDDRNPEAWIYLALSKIQNIKASQFETVYKSVKECILKATQIDSKSEMVAMGAILVANALLEQCLSAAKYYFNTADKKYIAFGEDRQAASQAAVEGEKGFSVLKLAFELNPTDSVATAQVSVVALVEILKFEGIGVPADSLSPNKSFFLDRLLSVFDVQEKVVAEELDKFSDYSQQINALIMKERKKLPPPLSVKSDDVQSSNFSTPSKSPKATIATIAVAAVVVVALFLAYSNHQTQRAAAEQKAAEEQQLRLSLEAEKQARQEAERKAAEAEEARINSEQAAKAQAEAMTPPGDNGGNKPQHNAQTLPQHTTREVSVAPEAQQSKNQTTRSPNNQDATPEQVFKMFERMVNDAQKK